MTAGHVNTICMLCLARCWAGQPRSAWKLCKNQPVAFCRFIFVLGGELTLDVVGENAPVQLTYNDYAYLPPGQEHR